MSVGVNTASYTPATRDFSALKKDVARYVLATNDAEILNLAGDGINDAVLRLNKVSWYWTLKYYDVALLADTADYELPSNYKDVRSAEKINSDSNPDGSYWFVDPKTFLMEYPTSTSSGQPDAFTVMNPNNLNTLTLSVPPSSDYVASYPYLRLWYYARVPTLHGDGDNLEVPSEVESYVLWHAKAYIASTIDARRYGIAKGESRECWQGLIRDNTETGYRGW